MVQDIHLYLVPGLIRERLPEVLIEHFVHVPWPGPASWSALPTEIRLQILESLTRADIVGFQTQADMSNFLDSCDAYLPGAVESQEVV